MTGRMEKNLVPPRSEGQEDKEAVHFTTLRRMHSVFGCAAVFIEYHGLRLPVLLMSMFGCIE